MKHLSIALFLLFILISQGSFSQKSKTYRLSSPNGKNIVTIDAGDKLEWSVTHEGIPVLEPSFIAMVLQSGEVLGNNVRVTASKTETIDRTFNAIHYIKDVVSNVCNQLTINCKGDYGVIFRAYDDGVAYRFITTKKEEMIVSDEEANFNFAKDYSCYVPLVRDFRTANDPLIQSFEALYTEKNISQFSKDTVGFLPALIDMGNEKKALLLEADLEDYPGMFLKASDKKENSFEGVFARYPLEEAAGGHNMLNSIVTKRADYIAKVQGSREFPWRAIIISDHDTALLNDDMVQKLASPSRIENPSWIKPGKVAWDWWNNWNVSHVNFRAGVNTETYKYYIDFAAANKLEYIVLDEGWSNDLDLMEIVPKINLQEIVDYGKRKNVGVILWAGWSAVMAKMDAVFDKYAAMGVKGFKIDFMDRDDQKMVASIYEIARNAAKHKLIVDYHGMYKPTGMQRTWPNIINIEGVKGMENVKWTPNDDVPRYDVSIPFIRMVAGPMDYTPGSMRNATKNNFRPSNSMPMSQGTRTHQLAMYVVFVAPLQMLSDNPTAYMREQESTDFIAKIPTVFDQTVPLAGRVGEYVAVARRKDSVWYAGAMTNWTARDLDIDFSFLPKGRYVADIFEDGVNADRDATDYKRQIINVTPESKLTIHMAPGGGWAARIYPVE